MNLPTEYIDYCQNPDSVIEGFLSCDPGYFALWPPDDVEESNRDLEVATYAPGFLGFGSNGGGELLAFDDSGAVYMLPMIGLSAKHAVKIGESWAAFALHIQDN